MQIIIWQCRAYSSCFMRAVVKCMRLPFSKIFSNFVHFCPNFQIFCPFLPFLWKITHIPLLSRIGPAMTNNRMMVIQIKFHISNRHWSEKPCINKICPLCFSHSHTIASFLIHQHKLKKKTKCALFQSPSISIFSTEFCTKIAFLIYQRNQLTTYANTIAFSLLFFYL